MYLWKKPRHIANQLITLKHPGILFLQGADFQIYSSSVIMQLWKINSKRANPAKWIEKKKFNLWLNKMEKKKRVSTCKVWCKTITSRILCDILPLPLDKTPGQKCVVVNCRLVLVLSLSLSLSLSLAWCHERDQYGQTKLLCCTACWYKNSQLGFEHRWKKKKLFCFYFLFLKPSFLAMSQLPV